MAESRVDVFIHAPEHPFGRMMLILQSLLLVYLIMSLMSRRARQSSVQNTQSRPKGWPLKTNKSDDWPRVFRTAYTCLDAYVAGRITEKEACILFPAVFFGTDDATRKIMFYAMADNECKFRGLQPRHTPAPVSRYKQLCRHISESLCGPENFEAFTAAGLVCSFVSSLESDVECLKVVAYFTQSTIQGVEPREILTVAYKNSLAIRGMIRKAGEVGAQIEQVRLEKGIPTFFEDVGYGKDYSFGKMHGDTGACPIRTQHGYRPACDALLKTWIELGASSGLKWDSQQNMFVSQ